MIKFVGLKRELDINNLKKAYVFCGNDAYLINSAYQMLCGLLNIQNEAFNTAIFSSRISAIDFDALVTSAQVLPFLSDYRLITVEEFYPKQKEMDELQSQFLDANGNGTVVAIKNTEACETLSKNKNVCVVDCNHLDIDNVVDWIRKKLSVASLAITPTNAKLIAEFCMVDMTRISVECEKLISFLAGKKNVETSDIQNIISKDNEYVFYEMTDAISNGNKRQAFEIIDTMFEKKIKPQVLLASIYKHYRILLYVAISEKESVVKEFQLKDYRYQKLLSLANKIGAKKIKKTLEFCSEYDLYNKTVGGDAKVGFYNLIFRILNI